jgi:hypothetical protein
VTERPDAAARPADAASARAGIATALREYERAFATRDIEALRRVWPAAPAAELARVDAAFRSGRPIDVRTRIVAEPALTGSRAAVMVEETRSIAAAGRGGSQGQTRRRTYQLEKQGNRWVIVSIAD